VNKSAVTIETSGVILPANTVIINVIEAPERKIDMRLLILIGLVVLSVYLLKKIYFQAIEKQGNANKPSEKDIGLMKKCQHCDLHVPSEQACFDEKGRAFCSEAHKQAYQD